MEDLITLSVNKMVIVPQMEKLQKTKELEQFEKANTATVE